MPSLCIAIDMKTRPPQTVPVRTPTLMFLTIGVWSLLTLASADCTAGQTVDVSDPSQCNMCPYGTFQPENQPLPEAECLFCSSGRSTNVTQASRREQCMAFCPSGQQIVPNTLDCRSCGTTSYKDNMEMQIDSFPNARFEACTECQSGFMTNTTGATSSDSCNIAVCGVGSRLSDNLSMCLPCSGNTYQDRAVQLMCKSCPPESAILVDATHVSIEDCSEWPNRHYVKMLLYLDLPWNSLFRNRSSRAFIDFQNGLLHNLQINVLDGLMEFREHAAMPNRPFFSPHLIVAFQGGIGMAVFVLAEFQYTTGTAAAELMDALQYQVTFGSLWDPWELYSPQPLTATQNVYEQVYSFSRGATLVMCTNGTEMNIRIAACFPCPVGTYQPPNVTDACFHCRSGSSTVGDGTASQTLDGSDVCVFETTPQTTFTTPQVNPQVNPQSKSEPKRGQSLNSTANPSDELDDTADAINTEENNFLLETPMLIAAISVAIASLMVIAVVMNLFCRLPRKRADVIKLPMQKQPDAGPQLTRTNNSHRGLY